MTDSIKLTIDTLVNLKSGKIKETKTLLANSVEEDLFVLRTKIETGIPTGVIRICLHVLQATSQADRQEIQWF